MLHLLIFGALFAILVAALIGNRIALVALAALVMMAATLVILMFGLGMDSAPKHELLWLIPLGWWFVILLGRWAAND